MSTVTPNLGLVKPDGTEFVDEDLHLNNNYDKLDALALQVVGGPGRTERPYCKIKKTGAGTGLTSSLTTSECTFAATEEETDSSMGDPSNNQIVVPVAGIYLIIYQMVVEENSNGVRRAVIVVDSQQRSGMEVSGVASGGNGQTIVATLLFRCVAGNTIKAEHAQNSGVNLNVTGDSITDYTHLAALWMKP